MCREAKRWSISLKDAVITLFSLMTAVMICYLLRGFGGGDTYVPLLFVLNVLIVSRLTDGYLWGIIAAVASVLGVNYVFTYPYMAFNFTISGYPVTFAVMLAVAVTTSTLTTHIKQQERLKLETDREKMRSNLLRAVSHDLRTPLTGISGSVGAVLDNAGLPVEEKRELLTGVRDDADWLIRMVENLLSVTRIEADGATLQKTSEAAEEVMAEAAAKFRKRFPQVDISVTAPEEVLFVMMDPVLIEQVLSNLLENAVFHGGHTEHIRLSAERQGSFARFTVDDDGDGINREILLRLFSDYFDVRRQQGPGAERRNMGIGLSVCMTIVKAHGGNIKAENLSGGGARFSFTLPLE